MWDLIFPKLLPEIFLILRTHWDIIKKKLHTSSCKEYIILVQLESTGIFSTDILKIIKYHQNPFSGSQAAPYRQTAGQTWQIIVAFRSFSNIPKKKHIHFITVRMLVPYKANEPNMLSQLHTTEQPSCPAALNFTFLLFLWDFSDRVFHRYHLPYIQMKRILF